MKRADSLEEFLRRPQGRYFQSRAFVYWMARPGLGGSIVWGRVEERDAAEYTRALDVALQDGVAPYAALHDCRRVEAITPGAFECLVQHLQRREAAYGKRIRARAVLRSPGFWGSFVAGFFDVAGGLSPTRVFDALGPALDWLDVGRERDIERELDALIALGATPAIVRRLRDQLAGDLVGANPLSTAKALGTSVRTLQRELRACQTSFSRELAQARITASQDRLLATDGSIKQAAHAVGFASSQHFSRSFRSLTGLTPTAWLERARSGALASPGRHR